MFVLPLFDMERALFFFYDKKNYELSFYRSKMFFKNLSWKKKNFISGFSIKETYGFRLQKHCRK